MIQIMNEKNSREQKNIQVKDNLLFNIGFNVYIFNRCNFPIHINTLYMCSPTHL